MEKPLAKTDGPVRAACVIRQTGYWMNDAKRKGNSHENTSFWKRRMPRLMEVTAMSVFKCCAYCVAEHLWKYMGSQRFGWLITSQITCARKGCEKKSLRLAFPKGALLKTVQTQGSHSGRRNASRPSSLAMFSACFLQAFVRDANLASCARKVFGGPFAKNARSGARISSRSFKRVALDSIT